MPIIKLVPPPCKHDLPDPDPEVYGEGSIWECGECHQRFYFTCTYPLSALGPMGYWKPHIEVPSGRKG